MAQRRHPQEVGPADQEKAGDGGGGPSGLTHHFCWPDPSSDEGFRAAAFASWSRDVCAILDYLPLHEENVGEVREGAPAVIRGGDGAGEPVLGDTFVSFNGDAAAGLAGGPFRLTASDLSEERHLTCTTEGKPYDLLVCAALLRLFAYFPHEVELFSTGGEEDWSEAARLCVCLFDQALYPMSLICR